MSANALSAHGATVHARVATSTPSHNKKLPMYSGFRTHENTP